MINNTPITFINFCVDIDRGLIPKDNTIRREFNLYEHGMYDNLKTILPIVLYTSSKNIPKFNHRNEKNLKINYFDKISIENEFPNFDLYKKYYPYTNKDEIETAMFYYAPLVVLKLKKVIDVMNENPFNSEYFFWIDCFFTRGIIESDFLYNEDDYLKMCENVKNKMNDKFILLNWGNRPFGFFWGGNKSSLEKVYEKYFDIFFEFLPKKIMAEELIFKIIMERHPELMQIIDVDILSQYKLTCQDFLIK